MHPIHHAMSSARKWGGEVEDTLPVHEFFDSTKSSFADFRHRALRHHAEGIFECEKIFGPTITLSTGRVIPTCWVGEQHVLEDLGRIPSAADWLRHIQPEPWMLRVAVTHREVEPAAPKATDPAEQQRLADLAVRHNLWLMRHVYEAVHGAVESFEHDDRVGPDLAYLLGAMLQNNYCAWSEDRAIVQVLRNSFPERDHPVWDHVQIEIEEENVAHEAMAD